MSTEIRLPNRISRGVNELFVIGGARLCTLAAAIALQSTLAWYLKPDGRGAFAACQVFAIIFSVLTCFGVYRGVAHYVAAKQLEPRRAFTFFLLVWLLISVLGVAAGLAAISLPIRFFEKAPYNAFVLAIAWAVCLHLFVGITTLLTSMGRFGLRAAVSLSEALLTLLLVLGAAIIFGLTSQAAIGVCVTSLAIVCITVLLYLGFTNNFACAFPSRRQVNSITSYGARFLVGDLAQTSDSYISLILVALFLPNQELGYFAVATAVFNQAKAVADIFRTVIDPRAATASDGCAQTVAFIARGLFFASCAGSIAFVFVGHHVVSVLFSPEFLPAMMVIYLLLPAVVLECATRITYSYFNGINRPEVVSVLTSIRLILMLILLLLIVPQYGLRGAAVVVTAATAVYSLLLAFCFSKFSGLSALSLFVPESRDIELVRVHLFSREQDAT